MTGRLLTAWFIALVVLGLPAQVKAEPQTITKSDKEAVFAVTTSEKSPTGKHNSLFCSLDVMQNGEPIRHSIGGMGTLRIDPPPKKKVEAKPAPEPKAAPKPAPEKRLSRLEQLRQAQAETRGE